MAGITSPELTRLKKGHLPQTESRQRLAKILFLFRALDENVTSNLKLWLRAPNAAFDGATPLEAIEQGHVRWLWETLLLFVFEEPSDAVRRLFAPAGRRRPLDRFHFQPNA